MAKSKHQKLADLMQLMLKEIENTKTQTKQLLDSLQVGLFEKSSILKHDTANSVSDFQSEESLKSLINEPSPDEFVMPLMQSDLLYWHPIQFNDQKLERNFTQALLLCPRADEISNELDWFEREMASDSLRYQLLTIEEYERQWDIVDNNKLKDPLPLWKSAKEECRCTLSKTIDYAKIFDDLTNSPENIDNLLFAPKLGQSLAQAYDSILKTEQAKSCRYGQPLFGMYKKKLEEAIFENTSWIYKRQAGFLAEWRERFRDGKKSQNQEPAVECPEMENPSDAVSTKTGRWKQSQGIDDITAAKLLRYFIDDFLANPQNKKMGEIACVLWIMIWIAQENYSERFTIPQILQITSDDISSSDEITIDGVSLTISWGLSDLLVCLKGTGKGIRKHRLFSNLDVGGKAIERAFHEASKALFPTRMPIQVGAFLISPHTFLGVRMCAAKRNAMRAAEPLIPLTHTHKEIKAVLRKH
jgi:hypothetical protein